jgi:hypothetical protein
MESVYFFFVSAGHHKGYGRIQSEKGTSAEGIEVHAGQIEIHDHGISGGSIREDLCIIQLRILEQGYIELCCFQGFFVEPEMGYDFLHAVDLQSLFVTAL